MPHCVALLSGGLDSMLAIRLMQEQGVQVDAVNFKTLFTCCQDTSSQAAARLGVRLTVLSTEDDYLELIKRPRFGYGKGANPCVDCRIYMFRQAHRFMEKIGAQFIVSGEVVGQRPMSQKRSDLETISHHAELDDLLLRPLSALRLPPTLPEREGWVDRSRLFGFVGRSRKGLIQLARQFGFPEIPAPSTGCSLTERLFSRKVHDLVQLEGGSSWDFELLKYGRHFRLDPQTKVIVGRREAENEALEYLHTLPAARSSAVLLPVDFRGPAALLIGPPIADSVRFAAGLVARHSNSREGNASQVRVATREGTWTVEARLTPAVQAAQSIASA